MGEIVSFFKDMLNIGTSDNEPIGLCGFDAEPVETKKKTAKPKRKQELRLSELMES